MIAEPKLSARAQWPWGWKEAESVSRPLPVFFLREGVLPLGGQCPEIQMLVPP